jgi:hypothetical protein
MKNRLFILGLLLLCKAGIAQTGLTNAGTLYIKTSSDILHISGDFTNNSGAALTNNGNLYVKGNLANNQSSMAIGTGTLYLNGTSGQTVSGSQKFNTYDLQTNNSAGITLNNDLSVSNTHTFTAGKITTSATPNYLIYEAGSSYTGSSDTKHVNGWVKKIGNTDFTFPVGDNTYERTIGLNISAASEFNVKYATPTPNTNLSDLQAPLVSIDPNEYWIINQVSGGSATVAMNWDDTKVAFPNWQLADIRVASYDGSQWTDVGGSATGNTATQGAITSGSVSSFSRFTFGSVTVPLPLILASFSAKYMGNYTALGWKTVDEQNVKYFIVERSDDGNHFYSIAQMPARNSGNTETYTTSDNTSINHIAYYRLRMVDIDGKEKLSKVVVITILNNENSLELTGNPVRNKIALLASHDLDGSFTYAISNMSGQILQKDILHIQNGGRYELSLQKNILPGIYSLVVSNKQQSFHYIVVVK